MKEIVLFVLSSILTPATLAAGQTTCLLASQIKVTSPLPAGHSAADWTVVSNSDGSCVARPLDEPLLLVASHRAVVRPVSMTEGGTVVVAEILLVKLGWIRIDQSLVSESPAALEVDYGRARRSAAEDGSNTSHGSLSAEGSQDAVVWF